MNIPEALAAAAEIGAPQTFLTHLTHAVSHADEAALLRPGVSFAYDGLRLRVGNA